MRSHAKAPSAGSVWIAAAAAFAAALLALALVASSAVAAVSFVATEPATEIQKDSAVLNGVFANEGQEAHYFFEWGETKAYGHTTPLPPGAAIPGGFQVVPPVAISGLLAGTGYHYRLAVSDLDGTSYGDDATFTTLPAVDNLTADPATAIADSSVELNASFDGDGTNATSYYFEWGLSTGYGNTTPALPGTSLPAQSGRVQVPPVLISGLMGGATYHYRAVVTSPLGKAVSADAKFRTAEAPIVDNLNSRNLQPTSAEVLGRINPRWGEATYHFEWGPTTSYGQRIPAGEASIGAGNAPVAVSAQLTGLTPGVTYHFRLVASNQYGETASPDQTVGFYPPNCPNAQLRQETRSNTLPDCRAYELVSPAFAQGAAIFPLNGPAAPLATSPSRIAYSAAFGTFPDEGRDPQNAAGDMYVSTRTDTGWFQRYIGRNAQETLMMGGPPRHYTENYTVGEALTTRTQLGTQGTPSLDLVASYDRGWPDNTGGQLGHPSNAPFVWDTTTGKQVARWPTNLSQIANGEDFVGRPQVSPDFSHFVFQSNIPFADGGIDVPGTIGCCSYLTGQPEPPGSIYDNDLGTGEVELISVKGDDTTTFAGFVLKVSQDGSHVLMSETTPNNNDYNSQGAFLPADVHPVFDVPGPFYMRTGGHTYEIAPGRQIAYVGMSDDGETVFLRSKEPLTSEDLDTSDDLYAWHQGDNGLTLLSVGSGGGAGNTDDCGAITWNGGKCNIEVIEFIKYAGNANVGSGESANDQGEDVSVGGFDEGSGGNGYSDSAIAARAGDIYFISPEQLVPGKGEAGEANLYFSRDGIVRFVAAMAPGRACTRFGFLSSSGSCASGPIARMQVTPDGDHMAFVTNRNVTGYDPGKRMEMYTFDPETGRIVCVSCRPDGQPPVGDVFASQNGLFQTYDGRVFFSTKDALVARDTNLSKDVYEYTEGRAQLISSGLGSDVEVFNGVQGSNSTTGLVSVSANGNDVYFASVETLVTQDQNGASLKIYDARTGGGYPAVVTPAKCEAADECHGAGVTPPALPPDRTSAPLGKKGKSKAHKAKKHKKKAHKKKQKKKRSQQRRAKAHATGKQGDNRG